MKVPDLNRLKVFYLIYTHKSVIAAAKVLHITQSAVSQHLKKLELELETHLFTRIHRRLVPTSQGEALYAMVAPFMESLEEGIQHIHQARHEPYGLLKIGAPVEFGQRYLPGIFASFREMHPNVQFYMELGHPTELLLQLKEGKLDLSLADIFSQKWSLDRELSLYSITPIFREDLILICSQEYYQKHQLIASSIESLTRLSYISYKRHAPSLKSWFSHHHNVAAPKLSLVMIVESVKAAITGVQHHMGLALVPSHLVAETIRSGQLVAIETEQEPIHNDISIVQLLDKIPTLTEKTFLQFCKKQLLNVEEQPK